MPSPLTRRVVPHRTRGIMSRLKGRPLFVIPWILVAAILVVAGVVGLTREPAERGPGSDRTTGEMAPPDTDADGISDRAESAGLRFQSGISYITDPDNPDTDGDGLTDRDEAGALSTNATW